MSFPSHPNRDAILAAYIAGESIASICARYKCSHKRPQIIAKRAGVYHLRPAPKPAPRKSPVLRPKVTAKPTAPSVANRDAVSAAHRIAPAITLPSLRFLEARQ